MKLAVTLLQIAFTVLFAVSQDKTAPSSPRPAPQVSGRLIGTDGIRQLILEYKTTSGTGTFVGNTQSTCKIPANSHPSEMSLLELSKIPKGSELTLFYIRHETRGVGTSRRENIVLTIRVDKLRGESPIPQGKMIPCFQSTQTSPGK
jgi:hypothetical protein